MKILHLSSKTTTQLGATGPFGPSGYALE